MNITLTHDSFCRDILSDVSTFLEFIDYLSSQNTKLKDVIDLLDMDTLVRIPGDFSDTASTGYADLAFRANVKREYLTDSEPVQVCVGFLLEHKSARDDKVIEQLRRYHYHMMVEKFKENALRGIPSVAIILYNGREKWNPLDKLESYPATLRDIVLPFKGVFVDVDDIDDRVCLEQFSPRLGAFVIAMKYARNPNAHKESFKKVLDRVGKPSLENDTLDLLTSMDVYLHKWLSENFKENFNMDFVKPPYKTIADAEREERENLEKKLAAKDKENAELKAKIATLMAAKQN